VSSCEKCWSDAYDPQGDQSLRYRYLVNSRNCTPEEQAGRDAEECPTCGRMTLHQHTREPMCGCTGGGSSHAKGE
jgi:hypothetical protein